MADRIGVCEECAARYKVPPHITATRAKCKKCSGIVRIPPADDETAEDAPATPPPARKPAAQSPARKPAARATRRASTAKGESEEKPARRRAGAAAGGRGGAARRSGRGGGDEAEEGGGRRGAGGRRRAPAPAAGGNKNMIIAIIAGVAILGGGSAFFMMNDDDTENTEESGQNTEEIAAELKLPAEGSSEGASDETPPEAAEGNGEGVADATEEALDTGGEIEANEATEEVPVEETIDTLVSFEDFLPFPGTTAEELEAITAAVGGMSRGGAARKRAMAKLLPFGLKAVPPLTNTFNGLDLTDAISLRDAWEVATFIQDKLTFGMVTIPLKGDYSEDLADLTFNLKTLKSLIDYVKRWYDPSLGEANVIKSQALFEKKKSEAER